MMDMPLDLTRKVRANLALAEAEIDHSIKMAAAGVPLAAENEETRLVNRIERKAGLAPDQAATMAHSIRLAGAAATSFGPMRAESMNIMADRPTPDAREAIWGDSLDFVNVSFLARGARAARATGRVARLNGQPQGTGFLIGDGLFITNNHVLLDAASAGQFVLQFDYEIGLNGSPITPTRYQIDASIFVADPINDLDFAIVAVGPQIDGPGRLDDFGFTGLSDASDKHMLGENVNIVQHPMGRFKEVVLRENHLVARLPHALHYIADTEKGSSGSPVFNNEWDVIALHHWGGPWREKTDAQGNPLDMEVNEGIRISAIVKRLRDMLVTMPLATRSRIEKMLEIGSMSGSNQETAASLDPDHRAAERGITVRTSADGRATWTIPVELSVELPRLAPGVAPAEPQAPSSPAQPSPASSMGSEGENILPGDFADRKGYDPDFLPGLSLPLPGLTAARKRKAAKNRRPVSGMPDYALPYHHFSIVMNKERKLAFYTACNIDGATAKSINRRTRKIEPLRPNSPGLENFDDAESMEASDSWYHDDRLDRTEYAAEDLYSGQVLPDFPSGYQRTLNMFQRGHLIRRLDPAWGDDAMALAAERDSFHWTNCTPQVGFFNQGRAPKDLAGSEGGKLWRSVENYVLRNAVASDARINSFTGPIFDAGDRPFRGILIPERYFKLTVWMDNDEPRALAMIADQGPVLTARRESLAEGNMTFDDMAELSKIDDFITTVAEVEKLTGIRFGKAVGEADIVKSRKSGTKKLTFQDLEI